MKKYIISIILVCVLIVTGGMGWWLLQDRLVPRKSAQIVQQEALSQSAAFASGVRLLADNKYAEAAAQFEQALMENPGNEEKILTSFYLASAYRGSGRAVAAIDTLHGISALNPAPGVQALAIEKMGSIYADRASTSTKVALFGQPPYTGLLATSTNQTLRRLYQYAASFYPLPYSNYAIAHSYLNSVLTIASDGTGQDTLVAELVLRAKAAVAAGDAAMTPAIDTFTYPSYRADALLERAAVLEKLERLHDTSLGDAGEAYRRAIDLYAAVGAPDDIARLEYAHYLASMHGSTKGSDIPGVLAPLYQAPQTKQLLRPYFTRIGGETGGQIRSDLIRLAKFDAGFKAYLLSLGWKDADFQ